jgi:acyl-CoA reductase-like NAD-dependent aldehyde dehydrogenase
MDDVRGASEVNGIKEYRYFADGEWRTAENHKLFDVYRPYDRGVSPLAASGELPEPSMAVDVVAKAFAAWSQSTFAIHTRLFFEEGGEPQ